MLSACHVVIVYRHDTNHGQGIVCPPCNELCTEHVPWCATPQGIIQRRTPPPIHAVRGCGNPKQEAHDEDACLRHRRPGRSGYEQQQPKALIVFFYMYDILHASMLENLAAV